MPQLGPIAQQARLLLQANLEPTLVIGGAALAGWFVAMFGRRAGSLRLPLGATIGLSGVLWLAWRQSFQLTIWIALALAVCWAAALLHLLLKALAWVVVRFRTPWRLEDQSAASLVDRRRTFETRLDQEVSRARHGARGTVTVVAISNSGPHRRQLLHYGWQCARSRARAHDLLHRCPDGTILAILPDTSDEQLAEWVAGFENPSTGTTVGHAVYPEDGRSAETLIDRALARMDELHAQPVVATGARRADPSCIPLGDDDLVFVDRR